MDTNAEERFVACPVCSHEVKEKNFGRHYTKKHLKFSLLSPLEKKIEIDRAFRNISKSNSVDSSTYLKKVQQQLRCATAYRKESEVTNYQDSYRQASYRKINKCQHCNNVAMPGDQVCARCS